MIYVPYFLVWTDMCQHVKNIKMFGVPNPSREERRKFCQKSGSDHRKSDAETSDETEDVSHAVVKNITYSKVCKKISILF